MTVTAPAGFRSAGIAVGLKSTGKPDLALVVNDGPQRASAAVFTSNRAQANPIIWSRRVVAGGTARAIVLNSGGANCFTGEFGYETTRLTAEAVAAALTAEGSGDAVDAERILVCSTGLIGSGDQSFRDRIVNNVPALAAALSSDDTTAPAAILTTDSVEKTSVRELDGWTIGAMAKGAGMLAPGLATMLVVITTDAVLDDAQLDRALRAATGRSFDRLDSDGCMSTNDQVTLLASGASGVAADEDAFAAVLAEVCDDLAAQLQGDAEGASHDIDIEVLGAASEAEAVEVGRSVARNNLFKAAIFGNDPNWGRVLAAIGTTDAAFDPYAVDVSFNGVRLCHAGGPDRPVEECDLTPRRTHVRIELFAGEAAATIRTNDLTHDYVHENSAYSS
ncbi:bifunctional ornithine acetyltransferase/N-acetylglutamate synthase [Leucobacter sp. OLJS4]|uniref:bifunctional glutamate N-acetyltransferase/amino-acid acetyltransferase ArgJ n=1 Tax=unclassified Leucobacter TaxID=2621730 RepID=UPI000C18B5DF|nr:MULTISPECIES: bifunctional glutamate N-acetyltransferase/amino-acid acetyltransferase ArgJ [unclassified Leucobacter]PII81771.1 bifunctional ornithine acetyltransferase/N-acetylglutamate synthase [Leucobacter sp. OLCALW19]PII86445.1 bifunctional ornithine acetyltransferase/N-acetylglutamate synthase [Leucobacter sp. OLTLW20]PII90340.1 bifunctional ornithine acetyltransferase/N-acetylglutamate synthase [Leucobacter sp. OLAS13]PII97373.1 bifunctional ornithine acetyltransferase/N-acetylglutama